MLNNLRDFFQVYGVFLLVIFLSFCIALPTAAELKYKHRNKVFTRLSQAIVTLLFTLIISVIALGLTTLL